MTSARRCSLGPTVAQQDKAMERLKRRQARKIADGLQQANKIASGKAKVLSVKLDYSFAAPADRRVHAEIRCECFFASFEAAMPWLKEHGVPEDVLTGAATSQREATNVG